MKRLEFSENSKLSDVLNSIADLEEKEIEIFIAPGTDILTVPTNIEIINHHAENLGKKVSIKGDFGKKHEEAERPASREVNLGFIEGKDVAGEKLTSKQEAPEEKQKPKFSLPKLAFISQLKGRKRLAIILGLLAVLVVAGLLSFWFFPRAEVILYTESQYKEAELTLVASADADKADAEKGIIPLKTLENKQEDVIESDATGTKTVGEPAKGRVTIVNRTTGPSGAKTFFKGTVMTTATGTSISFTLDNTATISAAPVGCTDNCPSAGVDVTATGIGESGNLPAGNVFKVGSANIDYVFAKNDTNFTGGSSKKVTVVSADDQKKAKEDLLKKLENKADKELNKENPDIIIPEGGFETKILDETYSKKVDEEASDFRLNLQVNFIAKAISEKDLKKLLIKQISDSIPNGFEINADNSVVDSEIIENRESELEIIGKIKASLIPDVDEDAIKKKIAGKGFGETDEYLKSLSNISGFEIKISPSFFHILGLMPPSSSRINIKIMKED